MHQTYNNGCILSGRLGPNRRLNNRLQCLHWPFDLSLFSIFLFSFQKNVDRIERANEYAVITAFTGPEARSL